MGDGRAAVLSCARCGTDLPSGAKFCGRCGAATRAHVAKVRADVRARHRHARRVTAAIACVYAGVLLGLVVVWKLVDAAPELEEQTWWMWLGIEIGVGAMAVTLLGGDALRQSLGRGLPRRAWWWGPATAPLTFALAWLYVTGIARLIGFEIESESWGWLDLLETVVFAALAEEWLCRGVLWTALRRVAPRRTTLVLTSLLFALLHCVGGLGGLAGFPHRFVGGLAFGWLRMRTGSLLPGILAHAMHNALGMSV